MSTVLQRITELTAPPVVGARYMVPTVSYIWLAHEAAWPVFLPKHEDAEHLDFKWPHYHVDPRFLNKEHTNRAARWTLKRPGLGGYDHTSAAEATAQSSPLNRVEWDPTARENASVPHPTPEWRPMRCYRSSIAYRYGNQPAIRKMRDHFAGTQCARGRAGWICPHKRFPLGSIQPDEHGVLTCPLHGLRIVAESGIVLAANAQSPTPPTLAPESVDNPVRHGSDGDLSTSEA